MEKKDQVDIIINQLKNEETSQSVVFNIFKMNELFEKAIDLVRQTNTHVLANSLNSDKQYNVNLSHVFYIEYVDRNIFLYTKDGSYWVKASLVSMVNALPKQFVQVSKNTIINVFKIQTTETALNGNLVLSLSTSEKVIVSRRYIKKLKNKLEKML